VNAKRLRPAHGRRLSVTGSSSRLRVHHGPGDQAPPKGAPVESVPAVQSNEAMRGKSCVQGAGKSVGKSHN